MFEKPLLLLSAALVSLALIGCSNAPIEGSADALKAANEQSVGYRLGAGDELHIAVFGEDNLSGDYKIAPDGNISLPGTTIGSLLLTSASILEVSIGSWSFNS